MKARARRALCSAFWGLIGDRFPNDWPPELLLGIDEAGEILVEKRPIRCHHFFELRLDVRRFNRPANARAQLLNDAIGCALARKFAFSMSALRRELPLFGHHANDAAVDQTPIGPCDDVLVVQQAEILECR